MVLQILQNVFSLLLGHVVSKVFSVVGIVLLARYLGVEKFGVYGTIMAYLTLFASLADYGLTTVTIRDVAQDHKRSESYFSHTLSLRMVLTVIAYLSMLLLGSVWKKGEYPLFLIAICGLFLFPEALRKLAISMLSAYERMDKVAVLEVLSTVFRYLPFLIAISIGAAFHTAFVLLITAWLGLAIGSLVVTTRYCLKHWSFSVTWPQMRSTLYEALPFGTLFILTVIHFKADIIMLSKMQGSVAVGFYEGAYKFIEAAIFIPASIIHVLLPVMSRYFVTDRTSYTNVYIHATRILALGILPIIIFVTFFSDTIILLMYGDAYRPSVPALSLLIWALFFIFMNAPIENIIVTSKMMTAFLPYSIANTFLNIFLNFLLIPKYSFLGASIATVSTKFTIFVVKLYFANRVLHNASEMVWMLGRLLAIGMLTSGAVYLTKPHLAFPFSMIVLVTVYLISLFTFKMIKPQDKLVFSAVMNLVKTKLPLNR